MHHYSTTVRIKSTIRSNIIPEEGLQWRCHNYFVAQEKSFFSHSCEKSCGKALAKRHTLDISYSLLPLYI